MHLPVWYRYGTGITPIEHPKTIKTHRFPNSDQVWAQSAHYKSQKVPKSAEMAPNPPCVRLCTFEAWLTHVLNIAQNAQIPNSFLYVPKLCMNCPSNKYEPLTPPTALTRRLWSCILGPLYREFDVFGPPWPKVALKKDEKNHANVTPTS